MEKMLENKVAIITGSGRGIGRAAALLFASEGARVVVSDIDPEPAKETVEEIVKNGGEAIAFVGDATQPDFGSGIVKAALDQWNDLHIIVNNAGFIWDGFVHKMSDDMFDTMLDIHLKAPFRIVRSAAPHFREAFAKEKESGERVTRKIVNISSLAGTQGNAGQINYSSAKSGILGFTKSLAKEWGRYNVQSNAVAFGWVETRLTGAKENAEKIVRGEKEISVGVPEAQRKMMRNFIALGRPGTPEEAAGVILFLASPLSDYVTGETITMSGGI